MGVAVEDSDAVLRAYGFQRIRASFPPIGWTGDGVK